MPKEIRNITCCGVEEFMLKLDFFLSTVQDELKVEGLMQQPSMQYKKPYCTKLRGPGRSLTATRKKGQGRAYLKPETGNNEKLNWNMKPRQ